MNITDLRYNYLEFTLITLRHSDLSLIFGWFRDDLTKIVVRIRDYNKNPQSDLLKMREGTYDDIGRVLILLGVIVECSNMIWPNRYFYYSPFFQLHGRRGKKNVDQMLIPIFKNYHSHFRIPIIRQPNRLIG